MIVVGRNGVQSYIFQALKYYACISAPSLMRSEQAAACEWLAAALIFISTTGSRMPMKIWQPDRKPHSCYGCK